MKARPSPGLQSAHARATPSVAEGPSDLAAFLASELEKRADAGAKRVTVEVLGKQDVLPAPGAFVAIFADGLDADLVAIRARMMGLSLRDTILVVDSDTTSFVLLLKRTSGLPLLDDVQSGGVLNIEASRVDDYRNPRGLEVFKREGIRGTSASNGRAGEASAERRYAGEGGTNFAHKPGVRGGDPNGRWPPNVLVLDGVLANRLDEIQGALSRGAPGSGDEYEMHGGANGLGGPATDRAIAWSDAGPVSRFFPRLRSMHDVVAWVERLLGRREAMVPRPL